CAHIKSLHKLPILTSCLTIMTSCMSPGILFAAMARKGASSADVEAMPSISNMTPIATMTITTIMPTIQTTLLNIDEEITEKIAANTKVITAIVKLNLIERFICEFISYPKSIVNTFYVWDGHLNDKNCGFGPVGFPKRLPYVTIRAVPLQNHLSFVTESLTGLPLRPHFNPV